MKLRRKTNFLHQDLKTIYNPINIEQTNNFSKEYIKHLEMQNFDTVPKANIVNIML